MWERKSSVAVSQSLIEDESVKNALEYEKSLHVNESIASTPRRKSRTKKEANGDSRMYYERENDVNETSEIYNDYDNQHVNSRVKSMQETDFYKSRDNIQNYDEPNMAYKQIANYNSCTKLPSLVVKHKSSISDSKNSQSQTLINPTRHKRVDLLRSENIFGKLTTDSSEPPKYKNPDFVELERDEISNLIGDLRIKYALINHDYTSLSHKRCFSSVMLKKKEQMEEQMKFIENSITKLSSTKVVIKKNENSIRERPQEKFSIRCKYSGFAD